MLNFIRKVCQGKSASLDSLAAAIAQLAKDQKESFQKVMTTLDNLKAKLTALNTSVTNEITAFQTTLAAAKQPDGSIPAADADALGAQIDQIKTVLDTETAALTPAVAAPVADPAPTTGS